MLKQILDNSESKVDSKKAIPVKGGRGGRGGQGGRGERGGQGGRGGCGCTGNKKK